jgi:PAS domain S-box-containing protein
MIGERRSGGDGDEGRPCPEVARGYLDILDAVLDAVIAVDAEGRIVFANRACETIFGYPSPELVGQPVEMLIPVAARAGHRSHRQGYSVDPQSRPMGGGRDLAGVRKDGSTFPAEVSLAPLPAPDGMRTTAVVRDLSVQREQQEAVRASQTLQRALAASDERFRLAFDEAPIGMLMSSARPGQEGTIIKVNRALCDLLGRPESDLLDRPSLEIFLPEDAGEGLILRDRLLSGQISTVDEVERRIVHAEGRDVWVNITAVLVRDEQGAPDYFFINQILDVTDRRQARIEARLRAERDHRIAAVLQDSLLPNVPGRVGQVQVAARYQPAGDGVAVGGDWYDVFALPDARIGVTIGDVAGHGIESAATMSRLRYTVRILADSGASPAGVITRLNQVMHDPDRPGLNIEIATLVHAQLDPATGAMTYCSAGHMPMLTLAPRDPLTPATTQPVAWPIPALGGPPIGVTRT